MPASGHVRDFLPGNRSCHRHSLNYFGYFARTFHFHDSPFPVKTLQYLVLPGGVVRHVNAPASQLNDRCDVGFERVANHRELVSRDLELLQ